LTSATGPRPPELAGDPHPARRRPQHLQSSRRAATAIGCRAGHGRARRPTATGSS